MTTANTANKPAARAATVKAYSDNVNAEVATFKTSMDELAAKLKTQLKRHSREHPGTFGSFSADAMTAQPFTAPKSAATVFLR